MTASRGPRGSSIPAGRQAHLRPAVLGVHLQHQPRGKPAGASDAARPVNPDHGQSTGSTTRRSNAIVRLAFTRSCVTLRGPSSGFRSTRRTACTARPATSRTRPQNIVWIVPEGGGGPELSQHVSSGRDAGVRDRQERFGRSSPGLAVLPHFAWIMRLRLEVEVGSAAHLALHHLEPGDLAFGSSIVPR